MIFNKDNSSDVLPDFPKVKIINLWFYKIFKKLQDLNNYLSNVYNQINTEIFLPSKLSKPTNNNVNNVNINNQSNNLNLNVINYQNTYTNQLCQNQQFNIYHKSNYQIMNYNQPSIIKKMSENSNNNLENPFLLSHIKCILNIIFFKFLKTINLKKEETVLFFLNFK